MKYSIIIPVYNVEKYLKRCLDSLVGQSYENIEIIAVDDGSKDNSLNILQEYEKKYKNIIVVSQKNQGSFMARTNGIKIATGDYCLFVDSDDWINNDTIEKINRYITEYKNVDIIKFRFVYEPSKKIQTEYSKNNHILSEEEKKEIYRDLLLTTKYNNLCNEVFKRKLYSVDNLILDRRISYGEDLLVNLNIFYRAKKIVLINDPLYHYLLNDDSITHKVTPDNIARNITDNIAVNKERLNYIKKYNVSIQEKEITMRTVDFLYDQIKDYICLNKKYDFIELQNKINEIEFYDFISKNKVDDIKTNKKIKTHIMNKEIYKIKRYVVFFKTRNMLKKTINKIRKSFIRSS